MKCIENIVEKTRDLYACWDKERTTTIGIGAFAGVALADYAGRKLGIDESTTRLAINFATGTITGIALPMIIGYYELYRSKKEDSENERNE
ncbi:hypothetical protein ACFL96_03285 [Thermoproteota archaeon]